MTTPLRHSADADAIHPTKVKPMQKGWVPEPAPRRFTDIDNNTARSALFLDTRSLTDLLGEWGNTPSELGVILKAAREELISQLHTWKLRVQVHTGLEEMPVEDPNSYWDKRPSAFVTGARLEVRSQTAWITGARDTLDDVLACNIWSALDARRQPSNVNLACMGTDVFPHDYCGRLNHCPLHQPETLANMSAFLEPAAMA